MDTVAITEKSAERLRESQKGVMLGVPLRNKIENVGIRNRTKVTYIIYRIAILK